MTPRTLRTLLAAAMAAFLVSCGGGGGSPGTELKGVAAIGAPVVDGTVTVRCASGPELATTTTAGGAWSALLRGQEFPCLVAVTGGNIPDGETLYSMAVDDSDLNVTPLTSLVLAQAFGKDSSELDELPSLDEARTALTTGAEAVAEMLRASGYASVPTNPLTDSFEPVAGDAYDDLLEQLARSLEDAGMTLTDMVEQVASGNTDVGIPMTHVFTAAELQAMPQLNGATIAASGGELAMTLPEAANAVGAFIGGGNGNKAVLQLPGFHGMKLRDFKNMSLDVKGPPKVGGKNVYAYVNIVVDLQCDLSPLPANATLADVRARRRILIYDPYYTYVQQSPTQFNESTYTTMSFDFTSPGWRANPGAALGTGFAVTPSYSGSETFTGFEAAYPDACIVDASAGDGGMFRDRGADAACATSSGLSETAPAACGKAHSGVTVILGDSNTTFATQWKVKNIRFEGANVRSFGF